LRAAVMRPLLFKGVNTMDAFQDWQHAALMRQLIANATKSDKPGFYKIDLNVTARQVDQLGVLVGVFDELAKAAQVFPADAAKEDG